MARTPSAAARAAIIDATARLMEEGSVRDVTIDAVATRSGVAKSTIYRHFADREDLLSSVIRANIAAWPHVELSGDLEADLAGWSMPLIENHSRSQAPRAAMEFFAEVAASPQLAAVHDEMVDEIVGSLTRILTDARQRGEIRPDVDVELCADAILGPLLVRRLREVPLGPREVATLFSYVLAGIRSSESPAR